jgi:hypothetical protein
MDECVRSKFTPPFVPSGYRLLGAATVAHFLLSLGDEIPCPFGKIIFELLTPIDTIVRLGGGCVSTTVLIEPERIQEVDQLVLSAAVAIAASIDDPTKKLAKPPLIDAERMEAAHNIVLAATLAAPGSIDASTRTYVEPPMEDIMGSAEHPSALKLFLGGYLWDFRRELSDSGLSGYLLDERDGRSAKIPASYWNSASCENVLWRDCTATVEIDGRQRSGAVVVQTADLIRLWRRRGIVRVLEGLRRADETLSALGSPAADAKSQPSEGPVLTAPASEHARARPSRTASARIRAHSRAC